VVKVTTFRERYNAVSHFQKPDTVPILSCYSITRPNMETVRAWQRDQGCPKWINGPED